MVILRWPLTLVPAHLSCHSNLYWWWKKVRSFCWLCSESNVCELFHQHRYQMVMMKAAVETKQTFDWFFSWGFHRYMNRDRGKGFGSRSTRTPPSSKYQVWGSSYSHYIDTDSSVGPICLRRERCKVCKWPYHPSWHTESYRAPPERI